MEAKHFTVGQIIYINQYSDICGFSTLPFLYLGYIDNYVIVLPHIGDYSLEENLQFEFQSTIRHRDTHLLVFDVSQCFASRQEAEIASGRRRKKE